MKKWLFFLLFALIFNVESWAQQDVETRLKHFNVDDNYVAIEGYDPVAYFKYNEPRKGDEKFSCSYKSIVYHFSSQETLDMFKQNPDKYEPAYGGWCAYGMGSKGEKVEMNPETFKIQNGRLLLFYKAFFTNTLEDWEEGNPTELEQNANQSWKNMTKKD